MKVLVTGATGFIGSHLVDRLLSLGHQVRGLARNPAKAGQLVAVGAEPAIGDVTDPVSLRAAVRGMETVFHVAARVTDWGRWSEFESVTVNGTEHMLNAAAEAGVARFLHVSTAAVYEDRFARKLRVITEDAPHSGAGDRAYGHYAKSKVMAEEAAWRFHREGAFAVSMIRPAWVYGPRDATILPRLIEHLESPWACWIGGRDPVVDPIYVTDVVDCAVAAATDEKAIGQAYNVAPDREIRLHEFLGAMCDAMDIPIPRFSIPYAVAAPLTAVVEGLSKLIRTKEAPPLTKAALASFTVDQHYDPTKALRGLGWRQQVSLADGARMTAAWMKSQRQSETARCAA